MPASKPLAQLSESKPLPIIACQGNWLRIGSLFVQKSHVTGVDFAARDPSRSCVGRRFVLAIYFNGKAAYLNFPVEFRLQIKEQLLPILGSELRDLMQRTESGGDMPKRPALPPDRYEDTYET